MADESKDVPPASVLQRAATLIAEAMDLLDAHGLSPMAAAHLGIALKTIQEDIAE